MPRGSHQATGVFAQYRSLSLLRFPTATRAIEQLRKYGPPVSAIVDVSNPGSRIDGACQAIVGLSVFMQIDVEATSSQLWPNWEPAISKWVVFFLRVVLDSVSTVEEESRLLNIILFAIPDLLDFENRSPTSRAVKNGSSSYLQPLASQIWLFIVDKEHPNLKAWSTLLIDLTVIGRNLPSPESSLYIPPPHDRRLSGHPHPYEVDAALGSRLIAQLDIRLDYFKDNPNTLEEFKVFILVLFSGAQCFSKDTNPLCIGSEQNHRKALRSIGRILKHFLVKWKWVHNQPLGTQESIDAHGIVTCLLFALTEAVPIDTPTRIQEIVETGLVRSLWNAAGCYYERGGLYADGSGPEYTFTVAAPRVLDQIATYIVHHCVLRPFIRNTREFQGFYIKGNYPERIARSETLKIAWRNLLAKADEFYGIRWALKQRGLCDNPDCPVAQAEQSMANWRIRYKLCMGCTLGMYCSLDCRKAHWNGSHKEECAQLAVDHRNGSPQVIRNDRIAFGVLLDAYIQTHSQILISKITTYHRTRAPTYGEPVRNPILYISFDRPDLPSPATDTELLNGVVGSSHMNQNREFLTLLQMKWEETGLNEIVLWADFPIKTGSTTYPLTAAVAYPLVKEQQDPAMERLTYRWVRSGGVAGEVESDGAV